MFEVDEKGGFLVGGRDQGREHERNDARVEELKTTDKQLIFQDKEINTFFRKTTHCGGYLV